MQRAAVRFPADVAPGIVEGDGANSLPCPGFTKYQTSLCTRLQVGGYAWRLNVLDKSQKAALQALAGPEARVLASQVLSFRCEIAQKYSGYPVTCQWFANGPAGPHEAAAAELRSFRNIRLSASTTGRTNFAILMWLQSLADVTNAEQALPSFSSSAWATSRSTAATPAGARQWS